MRLQVDTTGLGGPEQAFYSDQCMLMVGAGAQRAKKCGVLIHRKKKKKKKVFLQGVSHAANSSTCACYRRLATGYDEGQRLRFAVCVSYFCIL